MITLTVQTAHIVSDVTVPPNSSISDVHYTITASPYTVS